MRASNSITTFMKTVNSFIGFSIPREDKKPWDAEASRRGISLSDVLRELLREHAPKPATRKPKKP